MRAASKAAVNSLCRRKIRSVVSIVPNARIIITGRQTASSTTAAPLRARSEGRGDMRDTQVVTIRFPQGTPGRLYQYFRLFRGIRPK